MDAELDDRLTRLERAVADLRQTLMDFISALEDDGDDEPRPLTLDGDYAGRERNQNTPL